MKQDKKLHLIVGLAIGSSNAISGAISFMLGVSMASLLNANYVLLAVIVGLVCGFAMALLFGIGKEWPFDELTGGDVDKRDVYYTLVGGVPGAITGCAIGGVAVYFLW